MSSPNVGHKIGVNLFIICIFIILFHSSLCNFTTTTENLQRNNGSFGFVANGTKHFVLTKERRAVLILKYRSNVDDSNKRQGEKYYEDNHVNVSSDGPPILRSGTVKQVLTVLAKNSTTKRRKSRKLTTQTTRSRTRRRSKKYVDSLLYEEYDHAGKKVNQFFMRNLKEVADFFEFFLDMQICYGSC